MLWACLGLRREAKTTRKTIAIVLLFAVFLSAGLCTVQAQTYLYHDTVTESGSGSLTASAATDEPIFIQLSLNVSDLEPGGEGSNSVGLIVSDGGGLNSVIILVYSDIVLFTVAGNEGEIYDESFNQLVEVAISGAETLLAKFDPLGNVTLWEDGEQISSESLTAVWKSTLTDYTTMLDAAGTFEAWVSLTDPTPEPTPTPTPTATPTPWVHNTAAPIGTNIGGLNSIILLILLGGVGVSMGMLVISKMKNNIIEAIIIMMIMGTVGLVAVYWLIGGFI
jgi:hypothetical protein